MSAHFPDTLRMLAAAADALSEPRGRSLWCAPDSIPITTPNGEPVGAFVWDSQNVEQQMLYPRGWGR